VMHLQLAKYLDQFRRAQPARNLKAREVVCCPASMTGKHAVKSPAQQVHHSAGRPRGPGRAAAKRRDGKIERPADPWNPELLRNTSDRLQDRWGEMGMLVRV